MNYWHKNIWMSHSNLDIEYEAQKGEQEQDTTVFDFETSKKDIVDEQELTRVSESVDCQEQLLSKETKCQFAELRSI